MVYLQQLKGRLSVWVQMLVDDGGCGFFYCFCFFSERGSRLLKENKEGENMLEVRNERRNNELFGLVGSDLVSKMQGDYWVVFWVQVSFMVMRIS